MVTKECVEQLFGLHGDYPHSTTDGRWTKDGVSVRSEATKGLRQLFADYAVQKLTAYITTDGIVLD